MATVIDSLVVLLGLDASQYKKGREQAEKETKETARVTRGAADDITKSLTEVGKTVAGLFLGFESATGFAKWLGGINKGEAALGRTAANIGMSAHELNKWGNAAKLAGGSAEGVQNDFAKLTQDFIRMKATGEQSPLLAFLQNRGVAIRDQNNNLLNQGQIYEDLANKTRQFGRQYQYTMFTQLGLDAGHINYLLQEQDKRRENLSLAERSNDVTEESVKKAAELQMYWNNVGNQIEAAGQEILTAITPAFEQILKVFGNVNSESDQFTTGLKLIGSAAIIIKNIFVGLGDAIGGAAAAIGAILHGDFKGAAAILDDQHADAQKRSDKMGADLNDLWEQKAAKAAANVASTTGGDLDSNDQGGEYRNNNPGNLRPYAAGQATDARGIRTFGSTAEGMQALNQDITAKLNRGLDTISKIINVYAPSADHNNVPAYIADVSKRTGRGANEHLTKADHDAIVAAIIAHEGARLQTSGGLAVNNAAAGNQSSTTVTTGPIIINAPHADPRAVADQVPAAMQRKYNVNQADTAQS